MEAEPESDKVEVTSQGHVSVRSKASMLEVAFEDQPMVKHNDDGSVVVYGYRWIVLFSFCLAYFTWNMHTTRQTPLIAEYAQYFNTTNNLNFESAKDTGIGIDAFTVLDAILLAVFYPIAGVLVDTYGLKMLKLGSVLQAVSAWWFYLSFTNFTSAILSRAFAEASGVLIACSMLRIAAMWFPSHQRPIAIGISVLSATVGTGASLIVGPLFYSGDGQLVLDVSLPSCKETFKDMFVNVTTGLIDVSELDAECSDAAENAFCCYTPTNLTGFNLTLALLATAVAVIVVLTIRERPPTPPSASGHQRKSPGLWFGLKLMFSNWNYSQICAADFIVSGPPLVLIAALSRLFPPSVSGYDFYVAAAGLGAAIPISLIYARVMGVTKKFYELTNAAYTMGFLLWVSGTICLAVATPAGDITFLFVGGLSVVSFTLWSMSVYELKNEYVFNPQYNLEGLIVGIDRTIINLSSALFVAAIPPEIFENKNFPGRDMTFFIGSAIMAVGITLVWSLPYKRRYKRQEYEKIEEPLEEEIEKEVEKNLTPEQKKDEIIIISEIVDDDAKKEENQMSL